MIKGYKAFKKGLICDPTREKPFQFAENTEFEIDGKLKMCENGFHFCENPLDTLTYYPLIDEDGNLNDFATVEADDNDVLREDCKTCAKRIKINTKLSFVEFLNVCCDAMLASSGDNATVASSGDHSALASSGDYSALASSGDFARLSAFGESCVVCNIGVQGVAKASLESWITLAEWGVDKTGNLVPTCVKTEFVDGERIRANVFYTLKDGRFEEINDNEDN